jgi:hypothetical protein
MGVILNEPSPGCSGDCRQGRRPCPTPEACQLPDVDDGLDSARGVLVCVALATICWALLFWLFLT